MTTLMGDNADSSEHGKALGRHSVLFDIGNKGYLTNDERLAKEYDKDNNGMISINEAVELAKRAREEQAKAQNWRLVALLACFMVVVLALCNLGTSTVAYHLSAPTKVNAAHVMTDRAGATVKVQPAPEKITPFKCDDEDEDARRLALIDMCVTEYSVRRHLAQSAEGSVSLGSFDTSIIETLKASAGVTLEIDQDNGDFSTIPVSSIAHEEDGAYSINEGEYLLVPTAGCGERGGDLRPASRRHRNLQIDAYELCKRGAMVTANGFSLNDCSEGHWMNQGGMTREMCSLGQTLFGEGYDSTGTQGHTEEDCTRGYWMNQEGMTPDMCSLGQTLFGEGYDSTGTHQQLCENVRTSTWINKDTVEDCRFVGGDYYKCYCILEDCQSVHCG